MIFTRSRSRTLALALVLFLACAGSGGDAGDFVVRLSPPPQSLTAEHVAALGVDGPWDSRSADAIANETALLAREALSRGLDRSYPVQRALRVAVASRLLKKEFQPTVRPETLTDEELRLAYRTNWSFFNTPELLSVSHLLWHAKNARKKPEDLDLARTRCAEALGAAKAVRSAEEFNALKRKFEGKGLPIVLEEFRVWRGKLEKSFEDVAFEMKSPGEVSGCVPSSYGYHIIYFHAREAATSRPFETVKEEIRAKAANDFATKKFQEWLRKIRPTHRASIVPDALAKIRDVLEKEAQR